METIQEAARSLQHAQRLNSARPPITQSANFYPGSRGRSAGGVPKPPSRAPAQALHQRQGGYPTARPPRRPNHGKSAHESGAPSAHPRQPAEHYIPRSTINTRPVRGSSAKACLQSVPGGLRMLQQSLHASTAARGCTSSRCGQRTRQQQQQQVQVLIPKAAQPQDMPPIPCAAGPAQLHKQVATAPSGPEDAEASLAVAAKPTEQQEETSCTSSTQPASCMPTLPQFGSLAWDSSEHCAMTEQPDEADQQPQVHTQHTATCMPLRFGSFTQQEAEDLHLFQPAIQPPQLHAVPTAGSNYVEDEPNSCAGGASQPGEHVNNVTPEVGPVYHKHEAMHCHSEVWHDAAPEKLIVFKSLT